MSRKKLSIALLSVLLLTTASCRKYLDVNTNPNVVQNVGPEFLLPSAQIEIASALGVDLQVNGSIWAQYWTQSPAASQYKVYEQYSPTASTYDRSWQLFYASALEDLDRMEKIAAKDNKNTYVGISKLLKAYTYQVITDAWGDAPFTEALMGQPEDGGVVSPNFDAQAAIYDGIIALANDGVQTLKGVSGTSNVSGDLIYDGDIEQWIRFGNTLLLKLNLRLAEKNPSKAQSGVQALYSTTPDFIERAQDAQIQYYSTSQNQNPLYAEMVGLGKTQNLVASKTVLDSMTKGNIANPVDPRAKAFFKPAPAPELYSGLLQGFYNAPSTTRVAIPSTMVGGDVLNENSATAPVKFITSYESSFLQAEAAARGWAPGDDEAFFLDGIKNNFSAYDLDTASAAYIASNFWAQYPVGGTLAQKLEKIITQKWFCMTGNQGFEAWTEWRRTGYPTWLHVSENSIIGKTTAAFPHRFFYPDVEVQRNQKFPGQKLITDRVFWDIH